ncbi:neuroblastoma-amplified sequence-like isoform X1 [Colias croceus]|uniref:neuroblastoma-amplified sequence-like isoform X1 n=2 Tax=Colias crocea TaxID=72248 RepID=UPI001E27E6F7|nr:neuroblastoma-amplified sequence-like isoform X1 [Colias croceus]
MTEKNTILHELYVFSEWKPEPEYLQKSDNIFPENISALWKWLKFFGPKKSLIDSVTAHTEKQQKWHIALGDEGKVVAVLTDNILEIRTKRSDYATIAARTTVSRDPYAQWRKVVWSPDCSFLVIAYGNGVVSFFDLTASNLFNIPIDCSRPGGLECIDNTHAVSEIIFMPLRVKDTKWSWEVLVITYDGKLRGFLVSQTEGYKLHHTFQFAGGVSAAAYCGPHGTLYVAGVPQAVYKEASSPLCAGLTAWRILNDEPFYKLSVVSDELEAKLANERYKLYIPFVYSKNMNFIVRMVPSPDSSKLACIHCNGDVSIWRLPLLRGDYRHKLVEQAEFDLQNPLVKEPIAKDQTLYYPADVDWWSDKEIIVSRFSGAVSVCGIEDMINILGKKPEFFQGAPQVRCAHDGAFVALECESNVVPANKTRSDESMAVVKSEAEDDSMLESGKELFKSVLYAITDMETFQPKPKKITIASRVYRLLGVKSTTPTELFSRKIESGKYSEALTLAEAFGLDSDLVYQQQWRKNPVSTDAIQNYLSKVSKKIWVVHQCVDRIPESLPAARALLDFGLQLTATDILDEINKDLPEDEWKAPDDITLEDLNTYTSELLRCRHVMIFYKERLNLYEAILQCEKSTYIKDEYHRLRSNSLVYSALEIAKEGRIEALTCLWPYIKSLSMQLAVLDKIPESANPMNYQHLLPTKEPIVWFEKKSPIKIKPSEHEHDWCRKEIFRPIWNSNWSEDMTPESENTLSEEDISEWYQRRAREIEERSGLASHALTLITIATVGGRAKGMETILFHLLTLATLLYELNVENVTLADLEKMDVLDVCKLLTKFSTTETFLADLRNFVMPFLKRHESILRQEGLAVSNLINFLEKLSEDDLTLVLEVFRNKREFALERDMLLELAERCILAHAHTHQLSMACDLLHCMLKESDGAVPSNYVVQRVSELERIVAGCSKLTWRGVAVAPRELRDVLPERAHCVRLLARLARSHDVEPHVSEKAKQREWNSILKDMLDLQHTIFDCITREECHEIYASALLTSGDMDSIRMAADVLTCNPHMRYGSHVIDYENTVKLVLEAAREYFNSASSLTDPSLQLARSCLNLIERGHPEVEEEIDLIEALPILNAFRIKLLPIQIRLCEDRMKLIEDCLKSESSSFLASEKLLQVAKMLRVAGDDDEAREGMVLTQVCQQALGAGCGAGGGATALSGARRLAALRWSQAAHVLAGVARAAPPHTAPQVRADLFAAALAFCPSEELEEVLHSRLKLELESLQPKPVQPDYRHGYRWPSTDDEFSDAVSTPVTERKDILTPAQSEKKPLLNYLVDTIQNKFVAGERTPETEADLIQQKVHCQEFYSSLYPQLEVTNNFYRYDKFSIDSQVARDSPHSRLKRYYIQSCLEDDRVAGENETEVVQKVAEDLLYKDTALSVACLLAGTPRGLGVEGSEVGEGVVGSGGDGVVASVGHSVPALSASLYAQLLRCNAPTLRDNVYLARPAEMAITTLKDNNGTEAQVRAIVRCLAQLAALRELTAVRALGVSVDALLFNADSDYRQQVIYRLAKANSKEHARMACSLALKYGLDLLDVWLYHVASDRTLSHIAPEAIEDIARSPNAHARTLEVLWPEVEGTNYTALINFFSLLNKVDEKPPVYGLTATEHIKLLKKAKAASPDLDYKLLLEQPSEERFMAHILSIIKPENVALLTKFLRTLPPSFRIPVPVNTIYTRWLTKFFFDVPQSSANNKKWMQQYRECVSYFNKLSKEDILTFVENTCFSQEAIERVGGSTRQLMVAQAADYCQLEHENDAKINPGSAAWSSVGQELSRWARFLENFHSEAVQNIRQACDPPPQLWTELEMTHGDVDKVLPIVSQLLLSPVLRASALDSLLHCLNLRLDLPQLFHFAADQLLHDVESTQTLVTRMTQYHKEGIKFPEDLVEKVLQVASERGLAPHKRLGLLALAGARPQGADLMTVADSTVDLFKTEWADDEYVAGLNEDMVLSEEGRSQVFRALVPRSDTWARRRALADALHCWPHTPCATTSHSLHCEYIRHMLLESSGHAENLVLIKMLLRRPVLTEQEVQYLLTDIEGRAVMNAVWVLLMSKCDNYEDMLCKLLADHKETIQNEEIEEDLIKEVLDQGLFIKLVSSPLYSSIINYILGSEVSSGEPTCSYTVNRAVDELNKANFIAEAGHLKLMYMGVPTPLRGFSQSVLYFKNVFK